MTSGDGGGPVSWIAELERKARRRKWKAAK